jgi:carbonic anhydrase/acetyltransferase-like protein (isoleucine patch superfamily)
MKIKWMIGSSLLLFTGQLAAKWLSNQSKNVEVNAETTFNIHKDYPTIHPTAYVHPMASIIGQVHIGEKIFVAPFVSIRGDEGLRIEIGNGSNIQDGVVMHGLKNFEFGTNITQNSVFAKGDIFSIRVGSNVTLAHQSQVHGPSRIDDDVFIGMQCLVFNAYVQEGVVLEPGSKVIGVTIPQNRYVEAGLVITKQEQADELPMITPAYQYYGFNQKVTRTNRELAFGYRRQS